MANFQKKKKAIGIPIITGCCNTKSKFFNLKKNCLNQSQSERAVKKNELKHCTVTFFWFIVIMVVFVFFCVFVLDFGGGAPHGVVTQNPKFQFKKKIYLNQS